MRFFSGFGTDAVFTEALAVLRAQGAELVEITEFPASQRQEINRNELIVLLAELKQDMNAYLATLPPNVRTRTLADLIAFNREHAAVEMPLFGQDLFEQAEATQGLNDDYRRARETSLRLAGAEGIDRLRASKISSPGARRPAACIAMLVPGDLRGGGTSRHSPGAPAIRNPPVHRGAQLRAPRRPSFRRRPNGLRLSSRWATPTSRRRHAESSRA